uniref:Uncharacterized protein n=1 Tax=Anguilla anguilla TaxID=7936 RepID=A0A0E9RLX3_ANGAN
MLLLIIHKLGHCSCVSISRPTML